MVKAADVAQEESSPEEVWETFTVGQAPSKIRIRRDWRVLDVGSGHSPHPRADVLVEMNVDDNTERSGACIDRRDERLVLGDAQRMPFADDVVDYVIACHIAEHVDDPRAFCEELMRIGKRGYIETPGRFGELVAGERFHQWYVYKQANGLTFSRINRHQRLGAVGEFIYNWIYFGKTRIGHRSWKRPRSRILNWVLRKSSGLLRRLWGFGPIKHINYTMFGWEGSFPVRIK